MGLKTQSVELDLLTSDPSTPANGQVWFNDTDKRLKCHGNGSTKNIKDSDTSSFDADQLLSPNNSDWKVNALAPLSADSNNAALSVRLFDDTTEEGVGFSVVIPAGTINATFKLVSRGETAPGGARTVGLKLYNRGIPDNAAVETWSTGTAMADVDVPTNEFFQQDSESFTLATLGATAGQLTQFELTRVNPAAGTELSGDWALLRLDIEFS